jgi:hypothetical protein
MWIEASVPVYWKDRSIINLGTPKFINWASRFRGRLTCYAKEEHDPLVTSPFLPVIGSNFQGVPRFMRVVLTRLPHIHRPNCPSWPKKVWDPVELSNFLPAEILLIFVLSTTLCCR